MFQKYHHIHSFFHKCLIPIILLYRDSVSFIVMCLLSILATGTLLIVFATDISLRYFHTIVNQLFNAILTTFRAYFSHLFGTVPARSALFEE